MTKRKFEIDIRSGFGNRLWRFLQFLIDKFPDEIKEIKE